MNYPSAAGGLKMMFLAQILTIVGAVVTVVGAMLAVVTAGILSIVMLLGSLLVLAAGILDIVGLYKAGADDQGYRGALIFALIAVVVGVIMGWMDQSGILYALLSIVDSILTFLVVNAVCQTTGNLLHSMGKDDLAEKGNTVSKLYFICTVITVVCTLVGAIPVINILAGLAGIVGGVITIVGYVLYLIFLNNGGKALEY